MHVFKDCNGGSWPVVINVSAIRKVRALAGVDLAGLFTDKPNGLADLAGDPCKLVDVLYVLCRDEADRRGVSDEAFGAAMAGDVLEHATTAFVEELVDFFPDARRRAALRKVIEAGRKVGERLMQRAETALDAIDVDAQATRLIGSSGDSPGSSGSTPDLSPSANSR